ncbi:MAG: nucleotidyltransferase domain-containing protein [Eubacteriaceae bacterium]|nr:nucleotidyltransferase domain-containing protein [Eubacteriaceae bacterium]
MSDYYTVTQYAVRYGKDPGNVRRMLIQGRLDGEKLGNQWIIPKDTPYPSDRREKTGRYKNWRQKQTVTRNCPDLMRLLIRLSSEMHTIYGEALDKVILYGSYARTEQTEDSDVDIAVFLRSEETQTLHRAMIDTTVKYELEAGVTLSVITIQTDEYMKWRNTMPFYKNIDKEGIVLWKAA